MTNCPSCAAPLDSEGVCTACGALTRTFFRGLDLGAPQVAAAVARGLDFYRLLGIARNATTHQVARRYRQLHVLFPDDPSTLAAEPARRQSLLEVSGRVLSDPALRRLYDQMRRLHCRGAARPMPRTLARDTGDVRVAEAELQQAARLAPTIAAAWKGLAAIVWGAGPIRRPRACWGRALALDRRDERALLMAAGAWLRTGRADEVREAAAQLAALREIA
ncbi:MAG: hypothetical protein RLZZ387_2496 [Chloroflexota bacterium]|jgi:hypothetical protein